MITDPRIDGGKPFDWGKASADYAKYRDIYPPEFYEKIRSLGVCQNGQRVLDLGTGTGVLPRNLYHLGARWIGTDLSSEQISQAKRLAKEAGMDIDFRAVGTEKLEFPPAVFDVITACQCYWYFDHQRVTPKLFHWLKPDGRLLVLYMAWLPFEDIIAGESEALVLKYSPHWTGAGETIHPIRLPEVTFSYFHLLAHEETELDVPFTRETWHGRMKSCRGVGASLSEQELAAWEQEHKALLEKIAPEQFTIKHYMAYALLGKKQATEA